MKYGKIVHGRFEKRLNRFIAEVCIYGKTEQVHVKNTGRLTELLLPGADVLLELSDNSKRKTKYSLVAVDKNGRWVNIDSQAPNTVVFEALKNGSIPEFGDVTFVKRELTYGASRFDFYFEKAGAKGFIEVKGISLEKEGIAMFPGSPTIRGTKHVLELIKAAQEGYTAVILFLIQMKGCRAFTPYESMDETFAAALRKASEEGVQIIAYDCLVNENEMILDKPVPVQLYMAKGSV